MCKEFDIIEHVGTSLIKLNMKDEEIREIMGEPDEIYAPSRKSVYWLYGEDQDLRITFAKKFAKKTLLCETIEFFSPAKVYFRGFQLMGRKPKEVISFFKKIDEDLEIHVEGLVSYTYDIGVAWADHEVPDDTRVYAVAIEKEGAYIRD